MDMTVEEIENLITQLPQKQLKKFRTWYEKFDADAWEKQIENDVVSGKLDDIAAIAIAEHKEGLSRKL
jgi:hypothetical protein